MTSDGVEVRGTMVDEHYADKIYHKIGWRLLPLAFACYIAAYIDRVNVGFAKLQMLNALQFSETIYGLGAGIFFIGYFLFEVPSNVMLHRFGARKWIARIMLTWAVISAATAFVTTPEGFYVIRFLLGIAEAGFFPGIIYYFTKWYPSSRRGKATAIFLSAIPVAGILGGPISGWIMNATGGISGLQGWQWLFLLEAIPSVVLGLVVFLYLDDGVEDAKWLNEEERQFVHDEIAREASSKSDGRVMTVIANPQVWLLAAVYFSYTGGINGIALWLPTIINSIGIKDVVSIGLLSAIPWSCGVIGMYVLAKSADKHLEFRWHSAGSALIGAIGLTIAPQFSDNPTLSLAALSLATAGIMGTLPVFWGMPTAFLTGNAAAAGIALVGAVGNLSGFAAPYAIGAIKDATKSVNGGLYMLAVLLIAGGLLALFAKKAKSPNDMVEPRI